MSGAGKTVQEGVTLDPVTLAVLKGRLEQIADEMDATLYRSAFNPIIAEARDACHGLYHAETGATLVQGTTGLPIFVGAMAFAVKAVIDKVARDGGLQEGDTFLFNDPYDGGTHLNDFRLVRPIFRQGRLFCWLASVGHWLDIGGNVPGGFNASFTQQIDVHQYTHGPSAHADDIKVASRTRCVIATHGFQCRNGG
jgi:N-methylhydantoinase B